MEMANEKFSLDRTNLIGWLRLLTVGGVFSANKIQSSFQKLVEFFKLIWLVHLSAMSYPPENSKNF